MKKEDLIDLAYKTYDLLNGVVNPNNKSEKLIIDYELEIQAVRCQYYDNTQEIYINPRLILQFMANGNFDLKQQNAYIIHVIIHELMHCNQYINPCAYDNTKWYNCWIEGCANGRSYGFIMNYKEWLEDRLNVEIDPSVIKYERDYGWTEYLNAVSNIQNPIVISPNGPMQVF